MMDIAGQNFLFKAHLHAQATASNSVVNVLVRKISLRTFVNNPQVHIYQKDKFALITAGIKGVLDGIMY